MGCNIMQRVEQELKEQAVNCQLLEPDAIGKGLAYLHGEF